MGRKINNNVNKLSEMKLSQVSELHLSMAIQRKWAYGNALKKRAVPRGHNPDTAGVKQQSETTPVTEETFHFQFI